MAITITLNSAICSQPFAVIDRSLEAFRPQQRVNQIDKQNDGDDSAECVVDDHGEFLTAGRRQRRTGSTRQRSRRRPQAGRDRAWMSPANGEALARSAGDLSVSPLIFEGDR